MAWQSHDSGMACPTEGLDLAEASGGCRPHPGPRRHSGLAPNVPHRFVGFRFRHAREGRTRRKRINPSGVAALCAIGAETSAVGFRKTVGRATLNLVAGPPGGMRPLHLISGASQSRLTSAATVFGDGARTCGGRCRFRQHDRAPASGGVDCCAGWPVEGGGFHVFASVGSWGAFHGEKRCLFHRRLRGFGFGQREVGDEGFDHRMTQVFR